MGFYTPAVLVKDAQRHGLRIRPVDVQTSSSICTVHKEDDSFSLRLGLNYVRGLKQQTAAALVQERNTCGLFSNIDNLVHRVPLLNRRDLSQLARIGALNSLDAVQHRRDAVWQVEQAGRPVGPLLRNQNVQSTSGTSPLRQMNTEERLVADYLGTGLTTGPHPMAYRRAQLRQIGILSAVELQHVMNGRRVIAAGCVIARQRPGTALGFIFLSMEDETGIANVVIHPDLYEQQRTLVTRAKFLRVEGRLQNQDGVIHIKAEYLEQLAAEAIDVRSHDFH
jgi:error-prone DNA polymerase